MRRSRESERWMTPVGDWDWRAESSEMMGSEERDVEGVVRRKKWLVRRRAAEATNGVGKIAIATANGGGV